MTTTKNINKGRLQKKQRENVGIFPKSGTPPPPCLGMTRLFEKKNHGLFCILGGGSPLLKTVKNGSGIRVDPPLFFQNSHIFPFFFFFGNVP